jgi:hypothetical protein
MQDIRRIRVRIRLRRASVDSIWGYGLDCSGSNEVKMAEILNKRQRPKQNDNKFSSSGNITIRMGHLFQAALFDWLTDLQWDRTLTVPTDLGLIDRPFVPHNLISAQESPVPLPEFQMAPRHKTWKSSGSKKWTQIYYLFLYKVPSSESPPGSPTVPLWRKLPAYRAYLHISL